MLRVETHLVLRHVADVQVTLTVVNFVELIQDQSLVHESEETNELEGGQDLRD